MSDNKRNKDDKSAEHVCKPGELEECMETGESDQSPEEAEKSKPIGGKGKSDSKDDYREADSSPKDARPTAGISPYGETIAVILFFSVLLVIVFRPLFLHINDLIYWARGHDSYFWHWRYWVSARLFEAYLHAKPFNLWNLVYYGVLANSGFPEVGNISDLLFISYPLNKIFSFPAFFNIKVLLILLFNGWAAYFAVSRLTKNYGAAIVCGIFIIFNPHIMMMVNISRLRAALVGFMILFIYYFYLLMVKSTWKNAVLAGIFLSFSAIIYWFHGVFLVWTALLMLTAKLFLLWREKKKKEIMPLLGKAAVTFAILAVVFFLFFLPYQRGTVSLRMDDVKFFVPFPSLDEGIANHDEQLNRWGFPWLAVRLILADSNILKFHFSILFIIAALFAFRGKRKLALFFLVIFIFFTLLSYGPYLKMSANRDLGEFVRIRGTPVPMPYKFFFQFVPPTSRLQHPNRFLSMSAIALMFLGGIGLAQILKMLEKTTILKHLVAKTIRFMELSKCPTITI